MNDDTSLTFWDHLDVLRDCLAKVAVAVVLGAVVAFCFKDPLFDIILAPCNSSFITYRWLGIDDGFSLHLINTILTEQMMIHLKMSFCIGLLMASPYIVYVLFSFISPALYDNERRYSLHLTLSAYTMFMIGLAINYLLIFPLTVRFLGTYQISTDIDNMLTVSSYIDTLTMMSIAFGIMFEMPVVAWLLAKLGFIQAGTMKEYRRHAFVAILITAAVITPTTDAFTLFIVALPIWLLYELSIYVVTKTS